MKLKNTLKFFVIPAIALVLTVNIYTFINKNFSGDSKPQGQVESSGEALIGGSFSLFNQDGNIVKDTDFTGKLMLVYFGFTNCPDVCPTDMALITNTMNLLGKNASKIQPIFITVDPARDTPEQLKSFLANFYPGVIGLTGLPEQITDVVNKYRIYAKKVETTEVGKYLMDHSGYIYMMGKDGKYITHFNGKQTAEEIAEVIGKNL